MNASPRNTTDSLPSMPSPHHGSSSRSQVRAVTPSPPPSSSVRKNIDPIISRQRSLKLQQSSPSWAGYGSFKHSLSSLLGNTSTTINTTDCLEDPLETESRGTRSRRHNRSASRSSKTITTTTTTKSKKKDTRRRAQEKNEAACAEFFGSQHSKDHDNTNEVKSSRGDHGSASCPQQQQPAQEQEGPTVPVSPVAKTTTPTKTKHVYVSPPKSTDLAMASPKSHTLYVAPTRRKDLSLGPPPAPPSTRARAVPSRRAAPKVTRSALIRRSAIVSDDLDDSMSVRTSASGKSVTFRGPEDGLEQVRTFDKLPPTADVKKALFYSAKEIAQMQEDSLRDDHEKLQEEKDRIIQQRKAEKAARRQERQQRLQARRAARRDSSTTIPSSAAESPKDSETNRAAAAAVGTSRTQSKRKSSDKNLKKKDKADKRALILLQHGSLNALDLHGDQEDACSVVKHENSVTPESILASSEGVDDRPSLMSLKKETWHTSMSILQDTAVSATPSKSSVTKTGKLSSSKLQQQEERLIYVPNTSVATTRPRSLKQPTRSRDISDTCSSVPVPDSNSPDNPSEEIVVTPSWMSVAVKEMGPNIPTPTLPVETPESKASSSFSPWTPPLPLSGAIAVDGDSNCARSLWSQHDSPSPTGTLHTDPTSATPSAEVSATTPTPATPTPENYDMDNNRISDVDQSPRPKTEEEKTSPREYQPSRPSLQAKSLSLHSVTLHQHKRRQLEDDNSKSNRGIRLVGSSSCRDLLMNECSSVSHHSLGKRGSHRRDRGGSKSASGLDFWSKLFGVTTTV